jgi:hypothetical protein
MHSKIIVSAFVTILAMVPTISAHGLILNAKGDAGSASSKGLGVVDSTPRDGTRRNPFQTDSTRFANQRNVAAAKGFGSTIQGGANKAADFQGATMAQVKPGGIVTMTLHQVNADGAGPYTCMVNADGTGESFVEMQVTTQVPGRNGSNRATQKQDLPLAAQMPAGIQCTGTMNGANNVCMVRCQNNARAGPFGGVVPVQQVNGAVGGGAGGAIGGGTVGNATSTVINKVNRVRTIEGIAGRRFRRGIKINL